MNVTALDLEMNEPNTEHQAIIQIGAVVGDIYTGEVKHKFNRLIITPRPIIPDIEQLTGITDKKIAERGVSLFQAYEELAQMHRQYASFLNPITWGGGDSELLQRDLLGMGYVGSWAFGRRWIDVKTLHVTHRIAHREGIKMGLKKACHNWGVLFEGPAHDACQDALNTFKLYHQIVAYMRQIPSTED